MLLLNGAVDGLPMPFDCVKLRSADDTALSLGFDFAKTSAKCMNSAKCMKRPGALLWPSLMQRLPLQ